MPNPLLLIGLAAVGLMFVAWLARREPRSVEDVSQEIRDGLDDGTVAMPEE